MKISYDKEADAMYIEFRALDEGAAENRQLTDEIIADYAPEGQLAGIEILDATRILALTRPERPIVWQVEPEHAFA